jgi:exodeoxyribonuclease-1
VESVRNADERQLADFHPEFSDERLPELLLHFKARNYPKALAEDEVGQWGAWRTARIQKQLPSFMKRLNALAVEHANDDEKQFILQELQLWLESIVDIDF